MTPTQQTRIENYRASRAAVAAVFGAVSDTQPQQRKKKIKLLARRQMNDYKILQYDANEQKLKSIPFQAENNAQAVEKAKYIHLDEACTAAEIVIISGGVPTHVKFIKNGTLTIEQAAEFVGRSLPTIYHKWPQMNGRREGKNLYFDREQLCNYITARDSRKINAIFGTK